jgi:ribosome-associated toxin RatA of RatAB toxin-antitoxin module
VGELRAERTVEIEAPLSRCFELVSDLESTPDWQESMVSIEVLERDAEKRPTLCEVVSDAKIRRVTSELRFAHHPPDSLTWEQEEGEMKRLNGSWTLEDLGEGRTRATYSLIGDPGRMLGLLLRGPVEGKVKEFLTKDAAEGLKKAAESG